MASLVGVAVTCPYCQQSAMLVTGVTIYPRYPDLAHKQFWSCAPCNAYVGCHKGTERPMGFLANVELRRARMHAHAAFDSLWRSGGMRRSMAYAWLAERLGIPTSQCHIGQFDLAQCERVLALFTDKGRA